MIDEYNLVSFSWSEGDPYKSSGRGADCGSWRLSLETQPTRRIPHEGSTPPASEAKAAL
jgi:hypothetical protein